MEERRREVLAIEGGRGKRMSFLKSLGLELECEATRVTDYRWKVRKEGGLI